ncbi:MAG: PIN domain-containing protein [Phormidium sp. BM_Day4_Bin.17]|nr:PIN domain-containing protein [Phormidium sp. BM_Day4_Bin.17]UCJ13768.1 MAG: PIN domain-containing protein [Phormidium sp. PBR-2020]
MTSCYLLDTNIAIALLNGDPAITQQVKNIPTVRLSVTIVGELLYGAEKSQRTDSNRQRSKYCQAEAKVITPVRIAFSSISNQG